MTATDTDRVSTDESTISRRTFLQRTARGGALTTAALLLPAGRAYCDAPGKTIRMAVVGGGFGSTFWWHEHPNCRVTAVTDLYPARREVLKNRFSCDAVYDSLESMLRDAKDVDAVAVFSGAPDHARHVRMCMERGWHAISAVPTCISLDEAAMLQEIKEKTGLRYMLAESSWYRQETIFAAISSRPVLSANCSIPRPSTITTAATPTKPPPISVRWSTIPMAPDRGAGVFHRCSTRPIIPAFSSA